MTDYKIMWEKLKATIESRINNINEFPADVDTNLAKRVKELVEQDQLVKIQKIMKVLEDEQER